MLDIMDKINILGTIKEGEVEKGTETFVTEPLENDILNNPTKLSLLQQANQALHIANSSLNKIIFIYSKPKVGSTSLVTSLRIFASHIFNIIHIHDEEMLKILGNIQNITVNEIILYNKIIGKEVYVIDIYRTPIERKISTFFEKIETFHFNTNCEELTKYPIERIIERFNKVFPYLGTGDNFLDIYKIDKPSEFNYLDKYLYIEENGIKYIKLRLGDSELWGNILTNILNVKIKIIKDYETMNKPVKSIYLQFKNQYKVPSNFIKDIGECKYFQYYLSEEERNKYIVQWNLKSSNNITPFTPEEFKLYEYISGENNNYITVVQTKHYLDDGCICNACRTKRNQVAQKIINGDNVNERIFHEEAKTEFITQRIQKINNFIHQKSSLQKKPNDNKNVLHLMKNIVGLR